MEFILRVVLALLLVILFIKAVMIIAARVGKEFGFSDFFKFLYKKIRRS